MFRKLTAFSFILVILCCLALPAGAATAPSIVDEAGLFHPEEIRSLEELSSAILERYDIHAVILTVNSMNGTSAQNYADDYYDNAGYGEDGVLFLLSMSEREWYISTSGNMIYALTDYSIQQLGEYAVSYFSDSLWYDGFYNYLTVLPSYLDAYFSGTPVDGYADYSRDYYHGEREEVIYYGEDNSPSFGISLLCGIAAAGITLLIMRSSMNTKRSQRCASEYMAEGSWNLSQQRDIFLYSRVTKTRRQESSSGSKGGGSSVHRSSGGRRHGGGGGRF